MGGGSTRLAEEMPCRPQVSVTSSRTVSLAPVIRYWVVMGGSPTFQVPAGFEKTPPLELTH